MHLYGNNCRIFCARMQREVERLNQQQRPGGDRAAELVADARLWFAVLRAGLLPTLYPASVVWLCWDGIVGY